MEGTMKCAIYHGAKNIAIEERPIPQCGEKDVLVKVLRAGICGSDVGIYVHGGESYGLQDGCQFGHEMVGKIVEKGAEVADDLNVGDIVFVEPILSQKYGVGGSVMAGAFSEYTLVENAQRDVNAYVLDKDINLDEAVLIEPVSVGTQGAVAVEPKIDEKVVVLGAGTIGLSAAAGLLARGLKNVAVVDRDEQRLEKAEKLGAIAINSTKCDLREALIEKFGAFPNYVPVPDVDMYVDAAGAPALVEECFNYAREKTRYSIVSFLMKVELNGMVFLASQPHIYGSRGYEASTIKEVIDHITNKKTPIGTLVTKKYKHADFVEALEEASSGRQIKVVIDYEME